MEGSENSKVESSLKDGIDGSGKEEVEVVDFGEVIELPPEPATKQDGSVAVEVVQEGVEVENSGSSGVTAEKRAVESSSLVSGYEQKMEEAVAASDIPVSDTNVEASSGDAGSVDKELDVDSSIPASDAAGDGGIREVSEIPRSTEYQVANLFYIYSSLFSVLFV